MTTVECGICHRMVPADSVSWCFTSDEEGEYAVCPSCESGPLLSAEPNYIVMRNAVRQIVRGGLFPSYAAADAAGVIDALAVPGIQCNLTTTDRLAEVVESLTLDIHRESA